MPFLNISNSFSIVFVFFILLHTFYLSCAKEKKPGVVAKKDLKYIGCEVCERAISELIELVEEERNSNPSKKNKNKIEELKIIEFLESLCDPTKDGGEWLKRLDIVESKNGKKRYLSLDEPGGIAKCGNECTTIAKSCYNLLEEEVDRDDLIALIWKNKLAKSDLVNKVCKKMSSRCKKAIELPKVYNREDVAFLPQSEKDIEMEKLMAKMKEAGIGGSMYGREDMDEMMGMYDGMHDDDEDDIMGSKSFGSDNAFDETDYPSESSESNIAGSQIEF